MRDRGLGQSIGGHKAKDKGLSALASYYSLQNINPANGSNGFSRFAKADADKTNFWVGGLGYKFDKNVQLFGLYAKSDMDEAANYNGDDQSKAYDVTLKYKGADVTKPGSYDIYATYRYLGQFATIAPTYDISARDTKGWQIGVDYAVASNVMAIVEYYKGKRLSADYNGNDADYNAIYGRLVFFF